MAKGKARVWVKVAQTHTTQGMGYRFELRARRLGVVFPPWMNDRDYMHEEDAEAAGLKVLERLRNAEFVA